MALNSINTNIAAYFAQSNIGKASSSVSSSVARLSSGNRIVQASDDVAALAAGTSLRTQVTTLRTALLNASQGASLLQVADGALSQITEILQRQKAISIQASSGQLSDVERGFLNQEFSALATEIDRIVSNTKFNQVTLLNGSLSTAAGLSTNAEDSSATSGTTAANIITLTGAGAANDEITVNGVTVTLTSSAPGTTSAAGKVTIGADQTGTAANIAAFLNASTDPRLANLFFESSGGSVTANYSGGLLQGAYVVDAAEVTDGGGVIAIGTAANRTIATTNPTDGLGVDRTAARGVVSGSILVTGGSAATVSGQAINVSNVEDNADFIGRIGEGSIGLISGTFTAAENAVFRLQVGDVTYTTAATDIVDAAVVTLTFTGRDEFNVATGGTFTLRIAGGAIVAGDVAGQADVDAISDQLNASLSGITFTQNRDVLSFEEGEIVEIAGVEVANLNGFSVNYTSSNFDNVAIESIRIFAPTVGTTDARFEVVINGETFVSTAGIGNQIDLNTIISLQSTTDPTKSLSLVTGNAGIAGATSTALDIATQSKADALQAELERAFGIGEAGAKLSFQIGSAASDNIGVQISSVASSVLYGGASLSVSTQVGAQAASGALDVALNVLTATRSSVGALQSRFNFASAALESTIQNQDAARGVLLDTDVVSESTDYATSQVQLQAGIAVLAQANLLPQNLLKLIG